MLIQSIAVWFFLVSLRAVDSDRGGGNHGGNSRERGDSQRRPFIPNSRIRTRDNVCTADVINAGIFLPDNHPPDAPFVCSICTNSTTFFTCSITASRCYTRLSVETKATRHTTFCECKDSDIEIKTAFSEWVNSTNGGYDPCNATQPMPRWYLGLRRGGQGGATGGQQGSRNRVQQGGRRENSGERGGGNSGEREGGRSSERRGKRASEHRGEHRGEHGGRPGPEHGYGRPGSFNLLPPRVEERYLDFTAFMQSLNISNPAKLTSLECCMSQKFGLFENGRANITAWNLKAERKPDGVAGNAIKEAITQCASSTALCSVRAFLDCIMSTCFNQLQLISG